MAVLDTLPELNTNIDHGGLLGLGDDDHPIYLLADGSRALTGTISGIAPTLSAHLTTKQYVDDLISALDHGNLAGLSDDDHPQYSLVDGSRAFTAPISGVDPTSSSHLVTKNYVDGRFDILPSQIAVLDKDLITPPGSPNSGDRYIIAGTGGAWSVFSVGDIVEYNGSSWDGIAPDEGFLVWVSDEDLIYYFNGTSWNLDTHLNGGSNKHDASEIDVEGTYSNISSTPGDLESTISDIDSQLGTLFSLISDESIWNRAGTIISPQVANDDLAMGAGDITFTSGLVDGRDVSVDGSTLDAHLNGSSSKHDATEIDFELSDGSKKNIQASSDDVENAIIDLDVAIGDLNVAPSNYTPVDASIVADHLSAIDTKLGQESIWDRSGTTISPENAGDNLDLGSGNIIISGNVDGRDVSTDGSNLDSHLTDAANKHNADQIKVENSYSNIGSSANDDLETVLGDIDSKFAQEDIWQRSGSTISPQNSGDDLDLGIGNIILSGTVDGRDISTDGSTLDAHLNSGANKHDATEIDYERLDGSKKNIQASSDDVENALTDLDDAIGSLIQGTNYTATDSDIVADHLAAIDTKLGQESLWNRTGSTLSPENSGDDVDLGAGDLRFNLGKIFSDITDGAGVVAHILDTSNTISGSGGKLLSARNNNSERFAIDKDGNVTLSGTLDGVDIAALALDTLPSAPTSAVSFNSQNITSVGTVDGVDISALALDNLPSSPSGDVDFNGQAITNVGNVDGVDISDHDARHILAGTDEIDGDKLGISWNPSNYTPSVSPAEVDNVDHLTAHLAGIDLALANISADFEDDEFRISDDGDNTKKIAFQASGISTSTVRTITMPDSDVNLGLIAAHASRHERTGADPLNGDHLDITFNPSNYTPNAAISEADTVDDLAAHLKGIDDQLAITVSSEIEDDVFRIIDNSDNTKKLAFQIAGLTTATTRIWTVPNEDINFALVNTHASRHVDGGADEIDGDLIDIDFTPSNYTPDATPAEANDVDDLAAHLKGIDTALAGAGDNLGNHTATQNLDMGGFAIANVGNVDGVDVSVLSSSVTEIDVNVDDLITLSGVAENSTDLGTFTGGTIPDSQTVKSALQSIETAYEETDTNVDDLITLSGVSENSTDLGTFTGAIISDSNTIKGALQEIETAYEETDQNVDDLITLSGVGENSTDLGTFTGSIISDNTTIKNALQELETEVGSLALGSGRRQIYDISSGSVPPSSGSVGSSLGFFQALKFDPDTDNDIYFQFAVPDNVDTSSPITIVLKYSMSVSEANDVKLNLDYIAADLTDDVDPVSATNTLTDTLTPGTGVETLKKHQVFQISAAHIASTDVMVSCHLTRDADNGADTHTGTFDLLGIEILYTVA